MRALVRVSRVKQGLIEGMAKKRVGRPSLYKPEFAELTDEQQFKQCWALENLRPLWAADNIKKGAKVGCA